MLTSPDAINVIVLPGDTEFEKSWSLGTLCGDCVVIPIFASTSYPKTDALWIEGGKGYELSRVTVTYTHHVEMGLVITFHKAQGRTMANVILVLAKCPAGLHPMLHS
eukprot:12371939-Ditylum_brightwellii.AAC.1